MEILVMTENFKNAKTTRELMKVARETVFESLHDFCCETFKVENVSIVGSGTLSVELVFTDKDGFENSICCEIKVVAKSNEDSNTEKRGFTPAYDRQLAAKEYEQKKTQSEKKAEERAKAKADKIERDRKAREKRAKEKEERERQNNEDNG